VYFADVFIYLVHFYCVIGLSEIIVKLAGVILVASDYRLGEVMVMYG